MRYFLQLLLATLSSIVFAQSIIVNPSAAPESALTAEELTLEVLIDGGECSTIENFQLKDNPSAQFPGNNRSWGYFEKGNSNFPFEKGIILTSGFARNAIGPSGGIESDGNYNWTGDGDTNQLANQTTYNATVFEFDFVPYGNEISFNYIFASEEYPDFTCMDYNDVFGFIISGPGIVNDPGLSGKNIALLPNGLPVTINNVNADYCGDDEFFVPGPFQNIAHGGRTDILTAYSQVIPGQTYHIRLMVADSFDNQYDSAVFLEAGSFSLGSTLVDLEGTEVGEDATICGLEEYTLVVNLEAVDATFQWYLDDNEIPGATEQSYTATESGFYEVMVISGGCSTRVGVTLEFSEFPDVQNHEDFICNPAGTHIFDLTTYQDEISSSDGVIFSYYNSEEGAQYQIETNEITDIQNFEITEETTVYVRVENEHGCYKVAELKLDVGIGPDTQAADYPVCDDNGDGIAEFDITSYNDQIITSGTAGITFEYYLDEDLTQPVDTPESFNNTSNPQIIYVKAFVTDAGDEACISVEELTLIVSEFPDTQNWEETYCDNLNDNSEIIDLTQNEIIITQGMNVSLHYYLTLESLENGENEITDPENYEVNNTTTEIFVQINNDNATCRDYAILTIHLTPSTEVENAVLENCSIDGFSTYYLPDANENIVADPNGLTITYHATYNNAFENVQALPDDYENTLPNQTIYVRVESENGCFSIAELLLTTVIVHEPVNEIITQCDDPEEINDERATFDLTQMNVNVENALGGTDYTITYYLTIEDAQSGNNPISNPEQFENTLNPQTIYARATGGNGGCAGTSEFQIEVLPVPEFTIESTVIYCHDEQEMTYLVDGNFTSYTWTDPDGNVISTGSEVTFEREGIHTLEVTGSGMDCPAIREIDVIMDQGPTVTEIQVNGNTVTVNVGGAAGPYEYSYNNGLTWQPNHILTNVPSGVHTMLVRSFYGCISEGKIFGVLGIPSIITPNGDGYNDYMTVRGLEIYPDAHIRIFDRYGKIFIDRKMETQFQWDGKYMGRPLPSGSYWYIINVDKDKSISGHITIKN